MWFCFILEEQDTHTSLPMAVVDQLRKWDHSVDLLEPHTSITSMRDLTEPRYDAYILKTVSNGPGLSLLEAAEAIGIPTINSPHAIRQVRDKAVAIALAYAHDIPIPPTYFVAHLRLLEQIPSMYYPLVVKPTNGSCGRGIYRVESPAEAATLQLAEAHNSFFLAQRYMENSGFDIKLYVIGKEVFSVARRSPLHPEVEVKQQLIPTPVTLHELAMRIRNIFGMDLYGLDVIETPHGPMVIDINDFPSFGLIPEAVQRIASSILSISRRAEHLHMPILTPRQGHLQLTLKNTEAVNVLSSPGRLFHLNGSDLSMKYGGHSHDSLSVSPSERISHPYPDGYSHDRSSGDG